MGQFPLARLDQHVAQLPDALGVIRQCHAVLGFLQLELNLTDVASVSRSAIIVPDPLPPPASLPARSGS